MHRAPSPLAHDNTRSEVWVMDANGERASQLTHNDIEEAEAEISPDGSQVLFLAEANQRFEPYYSSTLFVVPAGGGTPRLLLPDFPYYIDRATWAPDGRSILAVAQHGRPQRDFPDRRRRPEGKTADRRATLDSMAPAPAWSLSPGAARMVFQFDEPTRFGDVWTLAVARRRHADARHGRLRLGSSATSPAAPGEVRVEERRRHHDRRPAVLSDRLPAREALSAGRPDARWPAGIRQVRLRAGWC